MEPAPNQQNVFLKLKKVVAPKLVIELCLRLVLLIGLYLIHFWTRPYKRHVSEEQLMKHFKNPRRDSISPPWATLCVVIVLPLAAFGISFVWTRNRAECCEAFLAWTLALTINAFITEAVKQMTGRLRPDFYYRCFPDGLMTEGLVCTGSIKDVDEGRKSFPSGHSSFSFCSMGFVSLWIGGRLEMSERRWCTLVIASRLAPLGLAAPVAVSRVFDNHHHWSDVLAGSSLGLLISYACYACYYPLDTTTVGDTKTNSPKPSNPADPESSSIAFRSKSYQTSI